jgi:hypothetical protein
MRELVSAVARLHSQLTGCPNAISQMAFEKALAVEPPEVAAMCAEFAKRRDLILSQLQRLGLETPAPRGAFYAFPNVAQFLDARGSTGFCEDLLEEQNLAAVPGSAFGVDEHIRLSYATSIPLIEKALDRSGSLATRSARRSRRGAEFPSIAGSGTATVGSPASSSGEELPGKADGRADRGGMAREMPREVVAHPLARARPTGSTAARRAVAASSKTGGGTDRPRSGQKRGGQYPVPD